VIDPQHRWLLDQITKRFQAAEAVKEGFRHWKADPPDEDGMVYVSAAAPPVPHDPNEVVAAAWNDKAAAHIVMNDPEFVMANCRGELGVIDKHRNTSTPTASGTTEQRCRTCNTPYPCPTLRSLHLAYRTRDGWENW
jgi:hypothetical protein